MENNGNAAIKGCLDDWDDLEKEFMQLEEDHDSYKRKQEEMVLLQKKCMSSIAHHRYRMRRIQESIKRTQNLNEEDRNKVLELKSSITDRKNMFREMEEVLPHQNGLYLRIILGTVNVSLLNKEDKYSYKHNYEQFKVTVSYIVMFLSAALLFFPGYRWIDAVLHFLLVWYYCTLTIRENILITNGSRIKGWWVTHHFISTVCAGITLIWPDGWSYQDFRTQYISFSIYISGIYVMQFFYQRGLLYRLKTLGESHHMDITVEGFMTWMWKGLAFLLPFLLLGYPYNLYHLEYSEAFSFHHSSVLPISKDHAYSVQALSVIYFILFLGNTTTTLKVFQQKFKKSGINLSFLKNKYRFKSKPKNL
ncbi:hypothetical protein ScPMuIL_006919 [Solemya velum]